MSQALRQSELFAGNNWQAIYRAFSEVNLNSSDFGSIRQSMVDYIRRNYPEDFNDWIESSEFVAIIDLLAYLGQSLAFRTDINARENFLEVARRRESVLRLARSLSYNAKRNYPSRGLAKITELRVTQDVYDSNGKNLNGISIRWDDQNNPDWFEQWVLVLNTSLVDTNKFGDALKTETIDNIETQLYRLNNAARSPGNFPFTTNVAGSSHNFDVVNVDFNTAYGFVEQMPDPNGAFHIIYRSDGNGNTSPNTGFFVYFKQGTLQKSDFVINEPQENRTIFVDTPNINETDVWVQSVDDMGSIMIGGAWTRVGHVPSDDLLNIMLSTENVTYNSIDPDIQNIYQVVTQEQDKIVLRFGDGRFGKAPTGNLRVWYRVSANENMTVRPEDLQGISVNIPFTSNNNVERRLNITFSLQNTVDNGVGTETNEEIRRRASRVYSTQGRMVSGSDYNEFPVQTNLAVKLKAVNRVYSGQSRYIDLNDPTGTYQNTKVFSDDGVFYTRYNAKTKYIKHLESDFDEIINIHITEMLTSRDLRDFYSERVLEDLINDPVNPRPINDLTPVTMYNSEYIADDIFRRAVYEQLETSRTFALGYNPLLEKWYILPALDFDKDVEIYEFNTTADPGRNSWLVYLEYSTDHWKIVSRGMEMVFESERDCKFFFATDYKSIDPETGRAGADVIRILSKPNGIHNIDFNVSGNTMRIKNDIVLRIEDTFGETDGYVDPSRVKVRYHDYDSNGDIEYPLTYQILSNIENNKNTVVHIKTYDTYGYPVRKLMKRLTISDDGTKFHTPLMPNEYGYLEVEGHKVKIYKGSNTATYPDPVDDLCFDGAVSEFNISQHLQTAKTVGKIPEFTVSFYVSAGVDNLIYQWQHFAPASHRIDPAIGNIIDIFVLPRAYNDDMIKWRNAGSNPAEVPKAPSELELRNMFGDLEEYKMFSDEIVWRPVKFKKVFGSTASPEYQAKFKIVKLSGTSLSDGEIKSKVIESMRIYFDVNNWDFGETFYFSELGAFIHRRLSTAISSVEIVPVQESKSFGDLREIKCAPDELFFSTAQVSDVDIITANTETNLRIRAK